jgi:hypothetical protein
MACSQSVGRLRYQPVGCSLLRVRGRLTSIVACSLMALGCGEDPSDDLAQQCVDKINEYRATIDLAPLARWTEMESCADDEARTDASKNQAHSAFPSCGESAQNECPGWPGPAEKMIDGCLEMMWAEGPGEDFAIHGHYLNMASTAYTKVACGFHTLDDGSVWSVQNFR